MEKEIGLGVGTATGYFTRPSLTSLTDAFQVPVPFSQPVYLGFVRLQMVRKGDTL